MAGDHRPRALVVGAVSRDLEAGPWGTREVPGGTVHYAGLALAQLGAKVAVVTRVHPDDVGLLGPLRAHGVEVYAQPSTRTTSYRNDYTGEVDRHDLVAASDPIDPADLPPDWRDVDLVHLGPLHPRDIKPEVAQHVTGLVGIDLQGLVRTSRGGQTVLERSPALPRFLESVQVVQASESELSAALAGGSLDRFVEGQAIGEMIVTRGARGALIVEGGRTIEIAARPVRGPHLVGAGDIFLASYLFFRVGGYTPADAAARAAETSAIHIERGEIPKGFRSRPRAS